MDKNFLDFENSEKENQKFYIGKECSKCGNTKRYKSNWHCVDCSYKQSKIKSRLSYHKEYKKNYQRNWYKNLTEEEKKNEFIRLKQWKRDNPESVFLNNHSRRAIKKQATIEHITAAQLRELKNKHNGICLYCRKEVSKLTLEHIVPLSRGGEHSLQNLCYVCQTCNSSKRSKLLSEWKPLC